MIQLSSTELSMGLLALMIFKWSFSRRILAFKVLEVFVCYIVPNSRDPSEAF